MKQFWQAEARKIYQNAFISLGEANLAEVDWLINPYDDFQAKKKKIIKFRYNLKIN